MSSADPVEPGTRYQAASSPAPFTTRGAVMMTNGDNGEPIVDALLDAQARRYGWPGLAPWPE